jgi:hypothetical protein
MWFSISVVDADRYPQFPPMIDYCDQSEFNFHKISVSELPLITIESTDVIANYV